MNISNNTIYNSINLLIGLVWFINGSVCKLLDLVPRHQEIVATILGADHALLLTKLIGVSEILLAFWIWSRIKSRWAAVLQIVLILSMNIIEYFYASEMLLWGKLNSVFALLFVFLIYFNEYKLNPTISQ
ncbi:MAG: DoxX-like family protein [Saprospiraceae bacterium]|nr:DoxX-like family protein [Saprospiraceae bacterium]